MENYDFLYLSGLINEEITPENNLDFFEKRKAGAAKIATSAKEKGGPAILTYWHFIAKEKPYEQAIEAIKKNKSVNYFEKNYDKTMKKLHATKFDQKEFQMTIGELEVWGELISRLK